MCRSPLHLNVTKPLWGLPSTLRAQAPESRFSSSSPFPHKIPTYKVLPPHLPLHQRGGSLSHLRGGNPCSDSPHGSQIYVLLCQRSFRFPWGVRLLKLQSQEVLPFSLCSLLSHPCPEAVTAEQPRGSDGGGSPERQGKPVYILRNLIQPH